MDERLMQFRIGMFVIVAGLVLTILLIWFGESPTLFREHRYLVVHFDQAPEISEGIPVRKSGIRIGEVVAIEFDERPGRPDGVLVTLSLESQYKLHAGSTPRIVRGLIGDVTIDMLPSESREPLATARDPKAAMQHVVEGEVAPDPAHALAAATEAFQNVKGTLQAIEEAAKGLSRVTARAEGIDEFLASFRDMGQRVGTLAERLDAVVAANQAEIGPAIASLRGAAEKVNATLDPATQEAIRETARQLAAGSSRLNGILADVAPLAADLGGDARRRPVTPLGQATVRVNKIAAEVGLLTQGLSDGRGRLNPNGTLQKLVTEPDLYNNLNLTASGASRVVAVAERAIGHLNRFAERIANDPGAIGRGALSR
jgi:phospholipid/cholesterol/gamma-HCH transport system substrate-binding protein